MNTEASAAARRVLLVDDEPLARMVARRALEGCDCHVTEADGCAQAEELWKTQLVDLVVLDHRLGDGLGLDLLRRMRAEGFPQTVIYLTAEPEEIAPEIRKELALAAVLAKPLHPDALREALRLAPEAAAPAPPGAGRRGRFFMVAAPALLNAASVETLRKTYEAEAWLALDARLATGLDEGGRQALRDWSQACRAKNGRLCLVGQGLQDAAFRREVDVVGDPRMLEGLGRKLASVSERLSLLDSVVKGP